jgi:hypothetical protein
MKFFLQTFTFLKNSHRSIGEKTDKVEKSRVKYSPWLIL